MTVKDKAVFLLKGKAALLHFIIQKESSGRQKRLLCAPDDNTKREKETFPMATVKPFRAYRPRKDLTAQIAALPYDVYNRAEAKEVVKKNPLSFLGIDRAETAFDDSVDTYADCVYEKATALLQERIQNGEFVQDDIPCYYLYELTMDGRSQTGIVACAAVDDYLDNTIKKHENTRAEKEQDRIRHVDVTDMQTGPIFLAYHANETLSDLIHAVKETPAEADFVSKDGIRHSVWVIADEAQIAAITAAFAAIDSIYIADGHHRCASAVKVALKRRTEHPDYDGTEEFNYFLSVLFADEELKILDYNRVLLDENGTDRDSRMAYIQNKCSVEGPYTEPVRPERKGQFGMYDVTGWYRLTIDPKYQSTDPVDGLDVSILQREILEPLFAIKDPKPDPRIDFVGGIRGLKELERRVHTDGKVAFSMYPTSIGELFAVADAGRLMPPKSTWFEPKLRSGLFLHKLS